MEYIPVGKDGVEIEEGVKEIVEQERELLSGGDDGRNL